MLQELVESWQLVELEVHLALVSSRFFNKHFFALWILFESLQHTTLNNYEIKVEHTVVLQVNRSREFFMLKARVHQVAINAFENVFGTAPTGSLGGVSSNSCVSLHYTAQNYLFLLKTLNTGSSLVCARGRKAVLPIWQKMQHSSKRRQMQKNSVCLQINLQFAPLEHTLFNAF